MQLIRCDSIIKFLHETFFDLELTYLE